MNLAVRECGYPKAGVERGFGLVELMVALVLGLIVVGGALSVFASNRQAFRTTEGLSRLQENARVGFEMMTRDIRDAAGTPCSKNIPIANVLAGASGNWMYDWGNGVQGFEPGQVVTGLPATGVGSRAPNTDAIVIHSGGTSGVTVSNHAASGAAADIELNTTAHGLAQGDIVLVCDYRQASVFQVTNNPAGKIVDHSQSGGLTPGNCSKGLGYPTDCSSANGNSYTFAPNAVLTKLNSVAWYVGANRRGGRSLFRKVAGPTAPEEIVDGVRDLQLQYLLPGSSQYQNSTAIGAQWANVNAVRVAFNVASAEAVGTGGQRVDRDIVHYAALRNRNQ